MNSRVNIAQSPSQEEHVDCGVKDEKSKKKKWFSFNWMSSEGV